VTDVRHRSPWEAADCPDCGEMMRHVGPVLDVCDECGQELLYRGCQGLGYSTVCERCYERMAEVV